MTEVIQVDPHEPDPAAIARAAARLRAGGLVAFPTETVYGLGVHALDAAAVQRLFDAKQRPATDPLIVHVDDISHLAPLVAKVPDAARRLARRFWPGPLTLVLPKSPAVPDIVTAGLGNVAVRLPSHTVARALIAAARVPVAAPSANLFSRPSPTQAAHVLDDLDGRIDMIVDGGATTIGVESTVLDLSRPTPTVLRPGAVTLEMLQDVLGHVETWRSSLPSTTGQAAPGMLEKHYSPRAPLTLFEGPAALVNLRAAAATAVDAGRAVGIVVADEDRPALGPLERQVRLRTIGSRRRPAVLAAALYAALRDLDSTGVDLILVRGFPAEGLGVALEDRLRRAAAGRIVRS